MSLDVSLTKMRPTEVYSSNITHNLNRMADMAGLYESLWHPERIKVTKAKQLIPFLTKGLAALKKNPTKYRKLNPPNGWGSYQSLVIFVENYLEACIADPDAKVTVSR